MTKLFRLTTLRLKILVMIAIPLCRCLFIWIDLQVIKVDFRERTAKDAGSSLSIRYWIYALDDPCCRFRFSGRPDLPTSANLPVRQVLHFEFQAVPGIRLPLKGDFDCAGYFGLPRLKVDFLSVTVEHQSVALRNHARVTLLPPLFLGIDVCFHGVVGKIGRAKIGS